MAAKQQELPEGADLVRTAVHEVDSAKLQLARASRSYEEARNKLKTLLAVGVCNETNGCTHTIGLTDQTVLIRWRIAFMLLANPVLDYQDTAQKLWGPLHPTTAKNRVNAHVQFLRNLGVIETLGGNRFKVDSVKLQELSGVFVDVKSSGPALDSNTGSYTEDTPSALPKAPQASRQGPGPF